MMTSQSVSAAGARTPPAGARKLWLDAGLRLAQREGRKSYSPAEVAAEAGLPVDTLRRVFGSFEQYCIALLLQLFDELRDEIVLATTGEPPGRHRARLGVTAYLDGCLRRAGLRRWFFSRNPSSERIAGTLRRQNQIYVVILGGEFKDIGWEHPQLASRLFIGMVLDIANAECTAGEPLPAFRETLWTYLDAG